MFGLILHKLVFHLVGPNLLDYRDPIGQTGPACIKFERQSLPPI